jgi:predicted dehydrogenase
MKNKRYCLVGTGSRAFMYIDALFGKFKEYGTLTGICDSNTKRMEYTNKYLSEQYNATPVSSYGPEDFTKMLSEQKADIVIVTSMDRTHHQYIVQAMQAGCDVISEKPMTVDCDKAEEIFRTIEETGRNLRVTFNYRYAPRNMKIKEILQEGTLGEIKSVHFEWLLDTRHGADYFRRWLRDKIICGGVLVHKSTHHFDLMNWWLDSSPKQVFAEGGLVFYGKENAEERGIKDYYARSTGISQADPFALDLSTDERMKGLYLDAESVDGYQRDVSVFSQGISIEDDVAVIVKYFNKAVMSYHLTAYSPWEGYRIAFNGTKGRLEFEVVESAYTSGGSDDPNRVDVREKSEFALKESVTITVRPHWETPYTVELPPESEGGHGGGDDRLLRDIFVGVEDDPFGCAADHIQGAQSILTGIAANKSLCSATPVQIQDMIRNYRTLSAQLTD